MRVLAVPVKPLALAKSRLAGLLTPHERAELTIAMASDVVAACLEQPGWQTWLVTRDQRMRGMAAGWGARPFPESATSLLGAVRQVEAAVADGELAIVLGDLPAVTGSAVAAALAVPADVVAARAASDGGTNLLVRRPASVIRARFGTDSFAKHAWAARRARVSFEAVDDPALAFDLDRPRDVARLFEPHARHGLARAAAERMGLAERLRAYA
ncbi:MAG TPA: 2-phospho-L-lactate guanylyltransferase [Actinomycetota bacterium]